jgi:hypothetical protein
MRDWWVIESLRFNNRSSTRFRVFEAAVGRTEEEAILHAKIADERLEAALMRTAIRRGEVVDQYEWQPVSRLIEHLSITRVTTEEEIASLDAMLLAMLQEHDFFLSDIEEDPATVVGGGIYEAT